VTRLVATELFKLRTTRTFAAMVGTTIALLLLILILTLALTDRFDTENDVRSLLSSASISGLFMLILGVVAGAGEYRHGTIASTLLVTPNRLRAVTAQTLGVAAAGLTVGLACAVLSAAIGLPWLSAKDAATLSTGELLTLFLGCAVYTALAAAFGVALGALMRNQVAAVVLVLVFLFVVDPALSALLDEYGKFSLSGLSSSMSGGSPDDAPGSELLPQGVAALIWAAYTVAVAAGAALMTARRDV
jgi:ABC-2 type transport system permease protein